MRVSAHFVIADMDPDCYRRKINQQAVNVSRSLCHFVFTVACFDNYFSVS